MRAVANIFGGNFFYHTFFGKFHYKKQQILHVRIYPQSVLCPSITITKTNNALLVIVDIFGFIFNCRDVSLLDCGKKNTIFMILIIFMLIYTWPEKISIKLFH